MTKVIFVGSERENDEILGDNSSLIIIILCERRLINLTYDSGFKIVFGTEGRSERLLMLMLNRLLGMKVVNVKYLPTERLGLSAEESKSFFDVYCKDASGRRFLIEMQMWSQNYYHKRAVYYSSISVQDQARVEKMSQKERGRPWDYYFAPVYQISFLNFPNTIVETKDDGENQYISHYVYKSKDTGRELGDETNIIFIDLAKFRKSFEECESQTDKWLFSIRNMHLLKKKPEGVEGTELDELYNEAYLAAWPPEKRSLYERHIMIGMTTKIFSMNVMKKALIEVMKTDVQKEKWMVGKKV